MTCSYIKIIPKKKDFLFSIKIISLGWIVHDRYYHQGNKYELLHTLTLTCTSWWLMQHWTYKSQMFHLLNYITISFLPKLLTSQSPQLIFMSSLTSTIQTHPSPLKLHSHTRLYHTSYMLNSNSRFLMYYTCIFALYIQYFYLTGYLFYSNITQTNYKNYILYHMVIF